MENLLGLLRLRVIRGVNLAIRDSSSSNPYVIVHLFVWANRQITESQSRLTFSKGMLIMLNIFIIITRASTFMCINETEHTNFCYRLTPQSFVVSCFSSLMQKLRTRVIKKNLNPEWNENLTLSVTDPILPVKIVSGFLHYNNLFFLSKIETEQNITRKFVIL
ncbi:unnamed protein product [Brassica oleracea]